MYELKTTSTFKENVFYIMSTFNFIIILTKIRFYYYFCVKVGKIV